MSFIKDSRIEVKSRSEVEIMREGGRMLAEILDALEAVVKPGISAWELENLSRKLFKKQNVVPAFLGYQGFPATICASINEEVVHGIPKKERILKNGDLLKLDAGLRHKGFFTDSARTIMVGDVDEESRRLVKAAKSALESGIEQMRPGKRLGDVSSAVQVCAESRGFSVVRQYTGHGIGRRLHEAPEIPNFGRPNHGPRLKVGMVFAVEPMINAGVFETRVLDDQWTVVTADGKRSAHAEHTIAILEEGPEILTKL